MITIRMADSVGRIEPQFVVEAHNTEDMAILKAFLHPHIKKNYSKDDAEFVLHGCVRDCDRMGYTSFNFGWKTKKNDEG